jgi:putative sporulation protein YyaC
MHFNTKLQKISPRQEIRVLVHDQNASQVLGLHLFEIFQALNPLGHRKKVLLAIGTDRSTGDSLGPLVGTRINELAPGLLPVFGTLDEPVHALNLKDKITEIRHTFFYPIIIAVDASLGKMQNIGTITLGMGPIQPGTGVHKELPQIGDVYITGVVNIGGYLEYLVLQNTRLGLVMQMANCIAYSLIEACTTAEEKYKQP